MVKAVQRETLSVSVPAPVADRARDAVHFEPGLTLSGLAARGLEELLERLERKRGTPYPRRPVAKLPAGRPVKARAAVAAGAGR